MMMLLLLVKWWLVLVYTVSFLVFSFSPFDSSWNTSLTHSLTAFLPVFYLSRAAFFFCVFEPSLDFWPEKDTLADWMLQQQQQCTRSLLLLPPKPDITFCCSLRGGGGGWSLLLLFLDLLESIGAAVAAAWQMASSYHQCQWGECVCASLFVSSLILVCVGLPDWHSNDHERVFLSFSSSVELWLNWLRHLSLSSERFRPGKEAQ